MHPVLSENLQDWLRQTPYSRGWDFVFPSMKCFDKVPLSASIFVADQPPAAIAVDVKIPKGARFGFHNLRHRINSISNWLVQEEGKPNDGAGHTPPCWIQKTLDLYTEPDLQEIWKAQGAFLNETGMHTVVIQ